MTHEKIEQLKIVGDSLSITTALGAFFSTIPWPEIAAFLSCCWMLTRLFEYAKDKIRNKK